MLLPPTKVRRVHFLYIPLVILPLLLATVVIFHKDCGHGC